MLVISPRYSLLSTLPCNSLQQNQSDDCRRLLQIHQHEDYGHWAMHIGHKPTEMSRPATTMYAGVCGSVQPKLHLAYSWHIVHGIMTGIRIVMSAKTAFKLGARFPHLQCACFHIDFSVHSNSNVFDMHDQLSSSGPVIVKEMPVPDCQWIGDTLLLVNTR